KFGFPLECTRRGQIGPRMAISGRACARHALGGGAKCLAPQSVAAGQDGFELRGLESRCFYKDGGWRGAMSLNSQDLQQAGDMSWASVPSNAAVAWNDIWQGLHKSWFWGALAMQDIRLRYRGSIIGPFWLTLSMAIMIGAMGFLYSKLFNQDMTTYL